MIGNISALKDLDHQVEIDYLSEVLIYCRHSWHCCLSIAVPSDLSKIRHRFIIQCELVLRAKKRAPNFADAKKQGTYYEMAEAI